MESKICSCCGVDKPKSEYRKHKETRDRLYTYCKECSNKKQRELRKRNGNSYTKSYEKSIPGFLMRTYRNMKSRVCGVQKKKAHLYENKDLLNKDEFVMFSTNDHEFNRLFKRWEEIGYKRTLTPSVDRIDSSKGYSIDNIRWLTHSENSRLGVISKIRKYNLVIRDNKLYKEIA